MSDHEKKMLDRELKRLKELFDTHTPGNYFRGHCEGKAQGFVTAYLFLNLIEEVTFRKYATEIDNWGM